MNKSNDHGFNYIDKNEIVEAAVASTLHVLSGMAKAYNETKENIEEIKRRQRWEEKYEWDARTRTTAAMRAKAVNGMTVNSDGVFVYVGSLEKLPRFLYEEIKENDS